MNGIFLCLTCAAACIAGEPPCCDRVEPLDIDPARGTSFDRHAWWSQRMLRRTKAAIAEIRSLIGDRDRARDAIEAHAIANGRTWIVRADRRWPPWWAWTSWMAAAINGRMIAAEMDARGSMSRWPPTLA